MSVNVINFITVSKDINFGDDTYKPNIILKAGVYEVIEWSYHNQNSPDYRYDYVDLIQVNTRERIHFMLHNPEKYKDFFTVHNEFVNM